MKMLLNLSRRAAPPKHKASGRGVRLLPAAMATVAVVLGLKAVAVAEDVTETVQDAAHAPAESHAATPPPGGEAPAAASCPAPTFAEQAGLSQSEVQVLQALGAR